MTTSAGLAGAARRTYNALLARIASTPGQQQQQTTHRAVRLPFRPQITKADSAKVTSTAQNTASISGLKFCLHMVAFAAPGVILSKKLCDGEKLENIIQNTQDMAHALIASTS
ncbi:hypothetical protein BGX28_008371 [Mortierella sp. GBA30]|nr:hypothetical protein BGX28_008371 [Mortierella sp. GBA30]